MPRAEQNGLAGSAKTKPLKKGSRVLAQRRPGEWYAGKVVGTRGKKLIVSFIDSLTVGKAYSKRSTKVLKLGAELPFDARNGGPYSDQHAHILAGLQDPSWTIPSTWVAVEFVDGDYRNWWVGRVVETNKSRSKCLVLFNDGDSLLLQWPQRAIIIRHHDAPHVLSGPYYEDEIERMAGESSTSPLPRPLIPASPRIGQRVIGTAHDFDRWWTGVIENVRPKQNIVVILFDNGKRRGCGATEYWPISTEFSKKAGPYTEDQAARIWNECGLKIVDALPLLPGEHIGASFNFD